MHRGDKWMVLVFILILIGLGIQYFPLLKIPTYGKTQIAQILAPEESLPEEQITKNTELTLLGKAEVSYAGGILNRNNNIELGVARINGTIVKNGEEFSFLKTLGPVLEADGFKEAKSFYNGEVILGLGGGLCHVSTTLFQSILASGLPITERHNHTFSVPYYHFGLDATISDVGPDFKFVNDTGHDIRISGYTKNKVAVFEVYGVKDGRVSNISEAEFSNYVPPPKTVFLPSRELKVGEKKCENARQAGFMVKRLYNVTDKDGVTTSTEFDSTYRPLGLTCFIGVDDATDFTGCNSATVFSPRTGVKCPTQI